MAKDVTVDDSVERRILNATVIEGTDPLANAAADCYLRLRDDEPPRSPRPGEHCSNGALRFAAYVPPLMRIR